MIDSRSYPVDDPEAYREWAEEHCYCHCCGIDAYRATWERWPGLSTHHLIKPGRSDEECNLLRLCQRCHDLAEGLSIRVGGKLLPNLTIGVCLTIKKVRDPANFDHERLEKLFGRRLHDLEEIPEVFQAEYRQRRPWDVQFFGILLDCEEIMAP